MRHTIDGKRFILGARSLELHRYHSGATFTVQVPSSFQKLHGLNPHYTFKIRMKREEDGSNERWQCFLLSGPDNSASYTYMGQLNPETGEFGFTPASQVTDKAWSLRILRRTLASLWEHNGASLKKMDKAGFVVLHAGQCGRCGKKLTVPESLKNGIGPVCLSKMS